MLAVGATLGCDEATGRLERFPEAAPTAGVDVEEAEEEWFPVDINAGKEEAAATPEEAAATPDEAGATPEVN